MSAEELENYEAEVELSLYREYRDVVSQFSYVVETERRFYLANAVKLIPHTNGPDVYYEVRMSALCAMSKTTRAQSSSSS